MPDMVLLFMPGEFAFLVLLTLDGNLREIRIDWCDYGIDPWRDHSMVRATTSQIISLPLWRNR